MMNEAKPFASLGPTLLARKGGARPAMRPQLSPLLNGAQPVAGEEHDALEDLGWNDMGHPDEDEREARIIPIGLSPIGVGDDEELGDDDEEFDAEPAAPIHALTAEEPEDEPYHAGLSTEPMPEPRHAAPSPHSRPELAREAGQEPEILRQQRSLSASVPPEPRRARRSAIDDGRRAAFTLRLDAGRHLKLRLASTIKNRSAQQLVTEALDRLLADIPEVEALAARVKRD